MPRQAFEVVRYVYGAPNKLQDVMRWALSDPAGFIPQVVADVVVQDEFTHDVVVPSMAIRFSKRPRRCMTKSLTVLSILLR